MKDVADLSCTTQGGVHRLGRAGADHRTVRGDGGDKIGTLDQSGRRVIDEDKPGSRCRDLAIGDLSRLCIDRQ